MRSQSLLQLRPVTLHPAPDRCVIEIETALLQQLLDIAQRQRITKIPADRTKDESGFGLPPFEDRRSGYHCAILSHHPPNNPESCNTSFDVDEAREAGIYLWTVPLPDGHLIYYVGETGRSFNIRLRQHYKELVCARYHVYSAVEFARGEKLTLWPGHWDVADRKSDEECRANCDRISGQIQEMVLVLRFFLAPLSCDKRTRQTRQRIEAAIAKPLYAVPGKVGAFQDQGILYYPRMPNEQPFACVASSPVPLLGVPERFWA